MLLPRGQKGGAALFNGYGRVRRPLASLAGMLRTPRGKGQGATGKGQGGRGREKNETPFGITLVYVLALQTTPTSKSSQVKSSNLIIFQAIP